MADTERISGGAPSGMPTCPTCPHLAKDKGHPGWGWCTELQNRVVTDGWVNGFTPSQSPSGSCNLHPERAVAVGVCLTCVANHYCPEHNPPTERTDLPDAPGFFDPEWAADGTSGGGHG